MKVYNDKENRAHEVLTEAACCWSSGSVGGGGVGTQSMIFCPPATTFLACLAFYAIIVHLYGCAVTVSCSAAMEQRTESNILFE